MENMTEAYTEANDPNVPHEDVVCERMNFREGDAQSRNTADAVARRSYGKLVAFLAARTRDVAAAEDALSEAFAAALADWPLHGCPSNPEAWLLTVARRKMIDLALLAVILHAEARRRARRNADGEYVPLANQEQALWDWQMIAEAEGLILRASTLGSVGRYQLESALQSAHVYRCRTGRDNWEEVVQLYDVLFALVGSPVVAVNRALAIAEMQGANAAFDALQQIAPDARLAEYQPYWAARAELLARVGVPDEARGAYEIAIGIERDPAVRRFLQQRRSALPA